MVLTLWAVLLGAAGGAGPLVIAETVSPPDMVGLGGRLSRSVETEARRQGLTVVTPLQLAKQLDDDRLEALRGCKLDAMCASGVLKPTGARRAVLASLERDQAHYLVRLALVDLRTGERLTQIQRSVLIASRRLDRDVAEALPDFLRGKQEATGVLVLASSVPGAQITVDDQPAGTTPLTLTLKPGRHRVQAALAGHYPVDRLIDVEAGGHHTESLRMTAHSVADAAPVDQTVVSSVDEDQLQRASRARLEAAGVLAGAAVVSLGASVGLHASLSADGASPQAIPALRRARNVTLGVGAAAAVGAGLVWLWASTSDKPAPVALTPSLSPDNLGVGLSGTFD